MDKVQKEFDAKRLNRLKGMIVNDKYLLASYVKNIQGAFSEGGNIYNSCLSFSKFTEDTEKKMKEYEKQLADISQAFDRLTISVGKQ